MFLHVGRIRRILRRKQQLCNYIKLGQMTGLPIKPSAFEINSIWFEACFEKQKAKNKRSEKVRVCKRYCVPLTSLYFSCIPNAWRSHNHHFPTKQANIILWSLYLRPASAVGIGPLLWWVDPSFLFGLSCRGLCHLFPHVVPWYSCLR